MKWVRTLSDENHRPVEVTIFDDGNFWKIAVRSSKGEIRYVTYKDSKESKIHGGYSESLIHLMKYGKKAVQEIFPEEFI